MGGVIAFAPAEYHVQFGQFGLDGVLEFAEGGALPCAQRPQRGKRHVGYLEQRFGVFQAGRGAELVDAVGKERHHLLPALAFGSRNPGVFKAAIVNAEYGQELLEHLKTAAGVEVAGRIVAVTRMAAGNQHAVRPVKQGLDDEQGVDAARAGHAYDTQIRGLCGAGHTSGVGAAIGAPVAEKTHNPQFFAF